MPDDVRRIFEEAREVSAVSPRSAAALLRLALQVLINDLEPGNGTLDVKIGRLVARGLSQEVARAMDVVRVIGNNAVHPGLIEMGGDVTPVPAMFTLLNLIVEQVIVRKAEVDRLFDSLPGGSREAIARRDGTVSSPES
ncbi:DUF4145 domain-containing protein [Cellulomonas dongxiuzhuiae]|uniref:DUF4145 domain-containing protein n=1 Tax=Cellulomonas dongxiuzhuiae TaxID=2819979 RepID=A0ABX8GMN4_9CELL|nr:DUF4145 domain-containing protein [Cellulomonas dongxiuzhuiae]QWC17150.1 DUF4145 domain-containing protein [Cellulomonas dongxiuzhuiae]